MEADDFRHRPRTTLYAVFDLLLHARELGNEGGTLVDNQVQG